VVFASKVVASYFEEEVVFLVVSDSFIAWGNSACNYFDISYFAFNSACIDPF